MRAECELRRTRAGTEMGWDVSAGRGLVGCVVVVVDAARAGGNGRKAAVVSARPCLYLVVRGVSGSLIVSPSQYVRFFSLLCCGVRGAPCAGRQPCSGAYIRSDQNGSVGPAYYVLLR